MVRKWTVDEALAHVRVFRPDGSAPSTLADEVERLRSENAKLRHEIELLHAVTSLCCNRVHAATPPDSGATAAVTGSGHQQAMGGWVVYPEPGTRSASGGAQNASKGP